MTKLAKVAIPIGLIITFVGVGLLFGPNSLPAFILIIIGLAIIFITCIYNFFTVMESSKK